MTMAPQRILEIANANPEPPSDFSDSRAATIAYGKQNPTPVIGGAFPSFDAQQEWKQVLAPEEDYDQFTLVGATGWALTPKFSGTDVPFTHPFGLDWEFKLALDQPPDNPTKYTSLLARGNQIRDEDGPLPIDQASGLNIAVPQGIDMNPSLLGVEIDGGLVPTTFSDPDHGVLPGDRMAVFGRWIVDCGHQVLSGGVETFRSEIHPPLLMAWAKVTTGSIATGSPTGPEVTRVLFTSRPYLVSQRFTTDNDTTDTVKIYDDTLPDDGPFFSHLLKEVGKVNDTVPILGIPIDSTMVEAHQKIKSYPFQGVQLIHIVVRTPSSGGHFGPIGSILPPEPLFVSFQFTVRSGCAVQVRSSGPDTIDVFIALNHAGYTPPPLPTRKAHTWSREDLNNLAADAGKAYLDVELISAAYQLLPPPLGQANPIGAGVVELILGRGIKTSEYDTDKIRSVNILDASHAVTTLANNIPAGQGVVQDDNQPYPVYGWLEVTHVPPTKHP
jgi:hypothetical protein